MSDLIKRSDAIKAVSNVDDYDDGIGFEVRSHCLVELELVPSEDRPRGEWIDIGGYEVCKNCHEVKRFPHWDFCPNCGADMREREGE